MSIRKRLAIGAGTATLALALGMTVLAPVVAGAQESTTTAGEASGAEGRIDRVHRLRGLLDDLVADGTITSAQADAVAEHLAETAFHGGHRRGRLLVGLEVAAEAIGIDRAGLVDALRDGQTIARVAAAKGVEAETVVDALVTEYRQELDQMVAAGSITAREAAERAATAAERITKLVNGDFDFWPRPGTRPVPGDSSVPPLTGPSS